MVARCQAEDAGEVELVALLVDRAVALDAVFEAVTTAVQAAPAEYETGEAVADAAGAGAVAATVTVEPGAADSTSEITVPMGASHDGAREA